MTFLSVLVLTILLMCA